MPVILDFWVPGHAKTKGSLDVNPGPRCHCCPACEGYVGRPRARDSAGSSKWRKLVAYSAEQAKRTAIWPQWWGVDNTFVREFPLARDVRVWVNVGLSLGVADVIASGAGDTDKLYRNVLDALTDAGVYVDDVQVVALSGEKFEAGDRGPGMRVQVGIR